MSSTAILSTNKRVRRSKRLGLWVPVAVRGKDVKGEPFRELTRAGGLNANGASLTLSCSMEKGQSVIIENQNTGVEQECRIVSKGAAENGTWKLGVEFTRPAEGFWEIYFPPLLRTRQ